MPRPQKDIPTDDIKGLKTLIDEGLNQKQIAQYYKDHGMDVDRRTIGLRIKELKESEKWDF
jgi:hypothetical protein